MRKRYAVVEPERSQTRRWLYSESDIGRLSLLKLLVGRGRTIGSIADLDNAELERRVQQSGGVVQQTAVGDTLDLALFGETLALNSGDSEK